MKLPLLALTAITLSILFVGCTQGGYTAPPASGNASIEDVENSEAELNSIDWETSEMDDFEFIDLSEPA